MPSRLATIRPDLPERGLKTSTRCSLTQASKPSSIPREARPETLPPPRLQADKTKPEDSSRAQRLHLPPKRHPYESRPHHLPRPQSSLVFRKKQTLSLRCQRIPRSTREKQDRQCPERV